MKPTTIDGSTITLIVVLAVFGAVALAAFFNSFFTVEQQSVGIIQRFGKFLKIANPGLNFKIPFVDQVASIISLKTEQLDVKVETKTKDDVFVDMQVSIQYYVLEDKAKDAFYKLKDAKQQITSYVFDVVRAQVPVNNLDDVFKEKDNIASAIETELTTTMSDYGYKIVKALVTNIDPDKKVKEAMNEINAALRLRQAAAEKGEGDKIIIVKKAEAEAESMKLHGQGIADKRAAIVEGLEKSVKSFKDTIGGDVGAKEVMNLVLTTQYFDTLKEMAANSKSNVIFTNSSPGALADMTSQISSGIFSAAAVTENLETEDSKKNAKN